MNTRIWIAAVAALTLAACGGDEQGQRVELDEEETQQGRANWPYELEVQVDSANLEFMNGDIAAAAERYRALTEEYPEVGTVWFGLYMAEDALGNDEAAEAALVKVEELAPGLVPAHEAAESGAMGEGHPPMMPQEHPPLDSVNPEDAPPLEGAEG